MLYSQIYACRTTIFDITTESPKVISDSAFVHDLNEVKLEPDDFYDSYRNPSKGNGVSLNNSELLQCFDKYPENRTGEI